MADIKGAGNNPLRAANVLRAVCIAFAAFYALKLVGISSSILLAGFLGILFGLNLSAFADTLQRWRIPRTVSAAGVVVLLLTVVCAGSALLGPTLEDQGRAFRDHLPNAIDSVDSRLRAAGIRIPMPNSTVEDAAAADSLRGAQAARDSMRTPNDSVSSKRTVSGLRAQLVSRIGSMAHVAGSMVSNIASALAGVFVVLFVAVFFAIEPDVYRRGVLHLVPHRHRARVAETMSATGDVLRHWLRAQLLAMLCVGALSTAAYFLIGLKAPIALGFIAGVCEFVPFVGPIAAMLPALGMALADSPDKALYVVLASIVIQQSEEMLIVPLLMKKSLTLPPILTILFQGAMGLAFGVIGLLVAVPLLATVMVPIKMLYVQDVVGDEIQIDAHGSQKS